MRRIALLLAVSAALAAAHADEPVPKADGDELELDDAAPAKDEDSAAKMDPKQLERQRAITGLSRLLCRPAKWGSGLPSGEAVSRPLVRRKLRGPFS